MQLELLQTLADEKALHLLPPLGLCPGPKSAYLNPPPAPIVMATSNLTTSISKEGFSVQRQALDGYMKLLADGALWKCVKFGVSQEEPSPRNGNETGNICVALAIVVHRLAAFIFKDTQPAGNTTSTTNNIQGTSDGMDGMVVDQEVGLRRAMLCSILRRCSTTGNANASNNNSAAAAQQVLSMLLRWDSSAMGASDVVTKERLEWIEMACRDNSCGELFNDTVMPALHA